jgi:hypothetical protein
MFSRFKQNFCPKKRAQEKEKFRCFTMLNVDRNACLKRSSVTKRSLIHFNERGILSETKVSGFLHLLIINCRSFSRQKATGDSGVEETSEANYGTIAA